MRISLNVTLMVAIPKEHSKVVERYCRVIRERMRAVLASLTYKLPGDLYDYLVDHVVDIEITKFTKAFVEQK